MTIGTRRIPNGLARAALGPPTRQRTCFFISSASAFIVVENDAKSYKVVT